MKLLISSNNTTNKVSSEVLSDYPIVLDSQYLQNLKTYDQDPQKGIVRIIPHNVHLLTTGVMGITRVRESMWKKEGTSQWFYAGFTLYRIRKNGEYELLIELGHQKKKLIICNREYLEQFAFLISVGG